ncbi:hypothetical protein ACEV85_23150 [Vibrio parahaemolyticus]|uniref:hypothetical protein n=1 Tax=Vibrio parahaemolyticus TaxID=670 RepID=UPI00112004F3|nr:hypothetical protein [Vibrio parahaemolyticus]EIV1709770.1 hypothetical protein [Vibrio parahaemolyticus]TOI59083.1 hypothetical protein CGI56_24085 [Vibrio parahaemolyticus]
MVKEQLEQHKTQVLSAFKDIMHFKAMTQLAYNMGAEHSRLPAVSNRKLRLAHSMYASEVGMHDEEVKMSELGDKFKLSETTHFFSLIHQQQVALFEHLFFDMVKIILVDRPERLPNKKKIDYAVIFESESKEEILNKLVEREINEIKYKNVKEWFDYLYELAKIEKVSDADICKIAEAKASRDILVHNAGIVNSIYLTKSGDEARFSHGDTIDVGGNYTKDSWSLFIKVLVKTIDSLIEKLA